MTNIQVIQSKIADVKAGIQAALFLGDDTQSLRATLSDLEAELANAERAAADEALALLQAEAERTDKLASEAAVAAHQSLVSAVGPEEVAGVKMPTPDADPAIEAAASRLAAARDRLEREQAIYMEHNAKVSALRGRLTEKARARDEILARRRGGNEQAGDAAEVSLLVEDIASLNELVEAAQRAADNHKPAAAQRLVNEAETALSTAQRSAVFRVKQARLQVLEAAFIEAHAELVDAASSVGVNKFAAFKASQQLRLIAYGTGSF
ncbi:hypothetical protein [Aeromonas sp. FDAARGOS 1407]|uniref:hypothetical protein n=1 Tax=Aeromonas TaxID=642 RepID=UPI001C218A96|nr:hypothetical protein [Aeromonas sp. FDAARGOS 1407]QXC36165.1 hypothetical protein I6L37_11200 [Aeromonas sp. FDAARGOS 1407]